jgi:predicted AAA+ superfamily ATPase
LCHDIPRWQKYLRDSIIEPVLIKDILGLSSVQKPALFRQTFELAMAFPAQEVSLQKLLGQ